MFFLLLSPNSTFKGNLQFVLYPRILSDFTPSKSRYHMTKFGSIALLGREGDTKAVLALTALLEHGNTEHGFEVPLQLIPSRHHAPISASLRSSRKFTFAGIL